MDKFSNIHNGKSVCEGEQRLLSETKEMSQSLAGPSIDTVEIPPVRLERGQDWNLEDQFHRVQNKVCNVRRLYDMSSFEYFIAVYFNITKL